MLVLVFLSVSVSVLVSVLVFSALVAIQGK